MIEIWHANKLYAYEGEVEFCTEIFVTYDGETAQPRTRDDLRIVLRSAKTGGSPMPLEGFTILDPQIGPLAIYVNRALVYEAAEATLSYGRLRVDGSLYPYKPSIETKE